MNNQRKQLEQIFKQLFANDNYFDLKLPISGTKVLEKIASSLGEANKTSSYQLVKQLLTLFEKNMAKKNTRAKFSLAMYIILAFCKNNNITNNASLAVMIAILILEFSKRNSISIERFNNKFEYFNKNDGPFLSPNKWTTKECVEFNIDYFLRDYLLVYDELKLNPFALSNSSFNLTVLERKNAIFMGLLLEDDFK